MRGSLRSKEETVMVREGEERIGNRVLLGVIGVSYRETTLQQREQVLHILQQAQGSFRPEVFQEERDYVLLATCHRVELYSVAPAELFDSLAQEIKLLGVSPYFYRNQDCFAHLFCVASGLDSLVLGETEIQGQVKRAYLQAAREQKLSFALHFLFQKALKEGKVFRAKGGAPYAAITIPILVDQELRRRQIDKKASLLFIGYSEINRSVAYHLRRQGFSCITFCSRQQLPTLSMRQVVREELCFQDPYRVVFLGSLELQYALPHSLWESIWDIPDRIVFDFAVPRALPSHTVFPHRYMDMDQISDWLREHRKEVNSAHLDSLREVAYRYWNSLNQRLERHDCVGANA